ncbi:MAG: DUF1127 domain-containing protein [Proteobacteria bacterium]|nr:MAG: DUF1127 domain-containing protein [Pseudomonadota bacterium]
MRYEHCDQAKHPERAPWSLDYCLLLVWRQCARLALDDHPLKDIGLSRTDAAREGNKPFWRS